MSDTTAPTKEEPKTMTVEGHRMVFIPELPINPEFRDLCYDPLINKEEYNYLCLVKRILEEGTKEPNRTGIDTYSLFGSSLRFSLGQGTIPLLTTKRVYWKGVVEENLWFWRGSTSSKDLDKRGVKIWNDNGTREFLDSRGLSHREEGDLGPVYGFQMRYWGANYKDAKTDYTGQGIDQLAQCIEMIKKDPTSRRILFSNWNPSQLDEMALPPCHITCQFKVSGGRLNCAMFQRSADVGLGVPFNIASYSLLTHVVAHMCGLTPGDFVHFMGDTHIYENHKEGLQKQLERVPRQFPKLLIKCPPRQRIEDYKAEDFELVGYSPHEAIKMEMAV